MKKAFTLIELMIVITVIGILMGVTMKFSSNRIVDLKAQSLKDRLVDDYAMIQSQNLASSYHGENRYSTWTLTLWNWMLVQYDGSGDIQLFSDMQHMNIKHISWASSLLFTPYRMGCLLSGGGWTWVSFDLEVNGNKTYCFSISSATCTLKEIICWAK